MDVEKLPNWPAVRAMIESDAGARNPQRVARKIAGLLGLPYIGSGAHRVALDLGSAILKVALGKRGLRENQRESGLFFSLPPRQRVHLATCLAAGPGWALFEKLIPMSYQSGYREHRLRMQEIRNEIKRLGIYDISSPRNWGLREGWGPVVLDYSLYTSPPPAATGNSASSLPSGRPGSPANKLAGKYCNPEYSPPIYCYQTNRKECSGT